MRISRRAVVATLAAGGLLPGRLAAQAREARLEDLVSLPLSSGSFAGIRRAVGTPGMAAFWRSGDKPLVCLVDGLRARGHAEPVTPADKWHLGSITKSFTATLFARAVEAGAIAWDTPLAAVLPHAPRPYAALTATELLSHHGGLAKDIPLPDLLPMPMAEPDARASRRRYADLALQMQPIGRPRRQYHYSNVGPVLVAHMLEERSGLSWEALLRREITGPLGLSSAGFGPPGTPGTFDQPHGHDENGTPVFQDNPAAMAPAGGLHMAVADLATWLCTHRDRSPLLRPESWAQLHRPRFGSDAALGWFVNADGSLWHNGSNTRWYAEVQVEPRTGLVLGHCGNDMALFARQKLMLPSLRRAAL